MVTPRQERILEEVKNATFVKISDLASLLDTSQVTIRKDVADLVDKNLIVKYHGKISMVGNDVIPYALRSEVNNQKKRAIAKAAAALLADTHAISLDAGTTTCLIAEELISLPQMNIVTNSLIIADVLINSHHTVTMTGGLISPHSKCLIGPDTEESFARVRTECAFVGCTGIRDGTKLCTGMRLEASVKRALIRSGVKVVAVVDDTKFAASSMFMFADFAEIDTLITTLDAQKYDCIKRIGDLGVKIIYADAQFHLE